jgi:hypothetical protein
LCRKPKQATTPHACFQGLYGYHDRCRPGQVLQHVLPCACGQEGSLLKLLKGETVLLSGPGGVFSAQVLVVETNEPVPDLCPRLRDLWCDQVAIFWYAYRDEALTLLHSRRDGWVDVNGVRYRVASRAPIHRIPRAKGRFVRRYGAWWNRGQPGESSNGSYQSIGELGGS